MGERADNSARWIVRRAAKAALANALCASGARRLVRSVARRIAGGARLVILSYHAPTRDFGATAREALPSLLISAATLRRQLEQVAREREIISLDEACHRLEARPSPAGRGRVADTASITFDDAYMGVHELALPVLRDLRIPATVFVPTGYVGTAQRLLHDRLFAALCELRRRQLLPQAAGLSGHLQRMLDACAAEGCGSTLDRLVALLSHDRLAAIALALEKRLGMHERDLPEVTRIMGWDELRALRSAGITVGGHTVNHVVLANVPLSRARLEIEGCRDEMERHLGEPPRHFAYPNGVFTPRVRDAVASAGFSCAVTTDDAENRRGQDPFTLKRKTLWENSTLGGTRYSQAVAACNLDGIFALMGRRAASGERPDWEAQEHGEAERAAG
ncbi:MAG TPA: polysaccharide deacetylase family protein [Anaeromyxobacteraceae bacterium]|nr:polysaccharide deacetylase family protein [Anaeromyxobacteraceae bacterium]